jgi:uncharacterized surface protein with fasciclin (FAS1) repeats
MTHPRLLTLLCSIALLPLAGCSDSEGPESAEAVEADGLIPADETMNGNSILNVAEDAGLVTFRTAVAQAGLDDTLGEPGPYTVFAPSDEAFNALPEGELESLLEAGSRDELTDLLHYHVLPREVMSGDLSGQMTVTTVQGRPLTIDASGGTVTLTDGLGNTATVISADNEAGNGVIHVIDGVLMPGEGEMTDEEMEGEESM